MIDEKVQVTETMVWVTAEPDTSGTVATVGGILYLLTLASSAVLWLILDNVFYSMMTALMQLPVLVLVVDDATSETWIDAELIDAALVISAAVCPVLLVTMYVVYSAVC